MERSGIFRGWFVVAGAFVVMFLAFGCAYSFTAFFESLQQEFGASRGEISLVFSIAGFLFFTVGALTGPLADRVDPRWVIGAGMAMIGAGLILASAAATLLQVYAAYGLGIGLGVGFAYVPAIGPVQRWFVRRRGTASGLAVAGIGVGTLAMPIVAALLIAAQGWRAAYLIMGIVAIAGGLAATALIEASPERRGLHPDGDTGPAAGPAVGGAPSWPGLSTRQALATRPFWVLYVAALMLSVGLFVPFVHLVPYAQDHGIGKATAVSIFGLVGLGSAAGRLFLGGVADRFGRRQSLLAMFVGLALMFAWWLVSTSVWQLAIFAFIYGTCYGGFVALAPAVIVDYLGARNASGIIGVLYTSVGVGTLLGPTLAGYAFDVYQSYTLPIAVSAAAALLAALCTSLLRDPEVWRASAGVYAQSAAEP